MRTQPLRKQPLHTLNAVFKLHAHTLILQHLYTHRLTAAASVSYSDYIIEEKNAVLQKKENEGFGFVLRGAKGEWTSLCGGVKEEVKSTHVM